MTRRLIAAAAGLCLVAALPATGSEVRVSLRGSRASMERQNRIAHDLEFSFLRTTTEVNRFADAGRLVRVEDGEDYRVIADWPYTRPVVQGFIQLVSRGYRAECGEPLVVTSLTRPMRNQPRNASPLSVHPAGMAADLRVSARRACVRWLEQELLTLESAGLVDATREYRPPHFHVAVFPEAFEAHLAARAADSIAAAVAADSVAAAERAALLAARPPVPTVAAATTPPVTWSLLLFTVGRLLLRV